MAKAFIFSLDAFVAFMLVLVVLHALVFISAVPSSYYGPLMQASYLARDTMMSLAVADASKVPGLEYETGLELSLLDYVITHRGDPAVIQNRVGALIPIEYGYRLEEWTKDGMGGSWAIIYDTKNYPEDPHNKLYHKLQASSNSVYFGYLEERKGFDNNHCYITCHGAGCRDLCKPPISLYDEGVARLGLIRLTVYR